MQVGHHPDGGQDNHHHHHHHNYHQMFWLNNATFFYVQMINIQITILIDYEHLGSLSQGHKFNLQTRTHGFSHENPSMYES